MDVGKSVCGKCRYKDCRNCSECGMWNSNEDSYTHRPPYNLYKGPTSMDGKTYVVTNILIIASVTLTSEIGI
jgi:hypothetical protein